MQNIKIINFNTLPSTNTYAKENADSLTLPCIIMADGQTAGRGRRGNTFFSPAETGLYMTAVFKAPDDCSFLTPLAAVAVCKVLESHGLSPKIKWVNDVFIDGQKVCGILTEVFKSDGQNLIALGIGINLTTSNFPAELSNAGSVGLKLNKSILASEITTLILNNNITDIVNEYQKRLFIINKRISYFKSNKEYTATVVGINDKCNLIVTNDDGSTDILSSGEISIRI